MLTAKQKTWLAGIFDARGCFDRHRIVRGDKTYVQFRFKLTGKEELVSKIRAIIGFGVITNNPITLWLSGEALIKMLARVKEFMIVRRAEAERFIMDFEDYTSG